MDFVSNRTPQIEEMLKEIGVGSIDELFAAVPKSLRRPAPKEEDGLSEFEALKMMKSISNTCTFQDFESYLGAGAYEHHVPALVGAVTSKSEFLTSYTPYQAEVSQGMLQAIFEFQSCVAALTGMDVANASVFDGSNAAAEGLLMTLRAHRKSSRILISEGVHPQYRAAVRQYVEGQGIEVVEVPLTDELVTDHAALEELLKEPTAGVLIQSPNFFGVLEEMKELNCTIKQAGALSVHAANPLSYGIYESAGALGADISVGDLQPFGLALQFGGPYVGYVACRAALLRQLPGRIVGETVDSMGMRGFTLTLQAREQHIRRDKATSNICTNQSLAALGTLVAMLWYGKEGTKELALANYQRACFLQEELSKIPQVTLASRRAIFNEFAIKIPIEKEVFAKAMMEEGIIPGYYAYGLWLIAVTETKDKQALMRYVAAVKKVLA